MNPSTDELIEGALRAYPLADVPPGLSKRVMRQVRAGASVRRTQAHFRLTWMDYALAFFVSLIPVVAFVVWSFLPRQAVLQLQFQWQLFQFDSIQPLILLPLGAAGLLLLLAFLFSLNFVLRPGRSLG